MTKDQIMARKNLHEIGIFRVKREGSGLGGCHFCSGSTFSHVLVIHGKEGEPLVLCPAHEVVLAERLFRDYLSIEGLREAGGDIKVFLPDQKLLTSSEKGH